jgi:hypothetical protein
LDLFQALETKRRRKAGDRLGAYRPYAKQIEFHRAGAAARERLLMAGNQLGKTYCGAAEAAIHLTGLYPDWWEGRRFDRPVRAWVGSKTSEVTRDGAQRLLVGDRESLVDCKTRKDALQTFYTGRDAGLAGAR